MGEQAQLNTGRRAGGRVRFCSDSRARARAWGRVGGLAHFAAEPKSARAHLNAGRRGGWSGAHLQ